MPTPTGAARGGLARWVGRFFVVTLAKIDHHRVGPRRRHVWPMGGKSGGLGAWDFGSG
jgi:hypothetical protein